MPTDMPTDESSLVVSWCYWSFGKVLAQHICGRRKVNKMRKSYVAKYSAVLVEHGQFSRNNWNRHITRHPWMQSVVNILCWSLQYTHMGSVDAYLCQWAYISTPNTIMIITWWSQTYHTNVSHLESYSLTKCRPIKITSGTLIPFF